MIEPWKTCVQAPDYLVSNSGRVVREKAGRGSRPFREVKPYIAPDGRPSVTIRVNGKTKTFRISNLVITAFKGAAPSPVHECCHNDGNPQNNVSSNLRWDTSAGNKADMVAHGTRRSGVKHHMAKLTEQQVSDIRRRVGAGELQRVVADDYEIKQATVSRIVRGVRWKGARCPSS